MYILRMCGVISSNAKSRILLLLRMSVDGRSGAEQNQRRQHDMAKGKKKTRALRAEPRGTICVVFLCYDYTAFLIWDG